jgi:hypothetical protein
MRRPVKKLTAQIVGCSVEGDAGIQSTDDGGWPLVALFVRPTVTRKVGEGEAPGL